MWGSGVAEEGGLTNQTGVPLPLETGTPFSFQMRQVAYQKLFQKTCQYVGQMTSRDPLCDFGV